MRDITAVKTKGKLMKLSSQEVSKAKQHSIPGGIAKMIANIKHLKNAGMVSPATSQFNYLACAEKQTYLGER